MASGEYTPTTEDVRAAWWWHRGGEGAETGPGTALAEFDRWLEATFVLHAAEVRQQLAERVRRNCTPSSEAYTKGGDFLIAAVADWIENPPEWVGEAH